MGIFKFLSSKNGVNRRKTVILGDIQPPDAGKRFSGIWGYTTINRTLQTDQASNII